MKFKKEYKTKREVGANNFCTLEPPKYLPDYSHKRKNMTENIYEVIWEHWSNEVLWRKRNWRIIIVWALLTHHLPKTAWDWVSDPHFLILNYWQTWYWNYISSKSMYIDMYQWMVTICINAYNVRINVNVQAYNIGP